MLIQVAVLVGQIALVGGQMAFGGAPSGGDSRHSAQVAIASRHSVRLHSTSDLTATKTENKRNASHA